VTVFHQCGDPVDVAECLCQHHEATYAELNVIDPVTSPSSARIEVNDNAIILQQGITISERCCIVVNAATILYNLPDPTILELERPVGTIRTTQEDTARSSSLYLHHHAAWEALNPGTYTYYLVNRSGAMIHVYAAWLKIVASDCEG